MQQSHERLTTSEKRFSPTHESKKQRESEVYLPSPEEEKKELDLARQSALKEATEAQDKSKPLGEAEQKGMLPKPSKTALKSSFNATMKVVGQQLSPSQRAFSKVIHNPVVEKISDVASTTIARPNAVLSGSIGALILTGALYLTARYYGFALSGSETILAFGAGWLLGLLFDIIRSALGSRR